MPQAETPSPGAPGDDPGRQEPQRLATGRAALVIPVATHIELRRETQQGGGHAGDIEPVDAPVPRDRPRHVAIEAERADRVWIPAKRLAQAVSSTPGVALLETEPGQERQRAEPCPRLGQPHGVGQRRATSLIEPSRLLVMLRPWIRYIATGARTRAKRQPRLARRSHISQSAAKSKLVSKPRAARAAASWSTVWRRYSTA